MALCYSCDGSLRTPTVLIHLYNRAAGHTSRDTATTGEHVWVGGHWRSNGNDYAWVEGRWVRLDGGHKEWVEGRWEHEDRGWHYIDGHWR